MRDWCQACHHRVNWALTEANRKWLALDPVPDENGNQAAYRDATGKWLTRQLGDGEEPYRHEKRYMPHLVTCAAARKQQSPAALPPNVIPISRAPSRQRGPQPKGT
jgi:hypothetical protein